MLANREANTCAELTVSAARSTRGAPYSPRSASHGPARIRGARRYVITIELFGVPRFRAGLESVTVEATSLGEAFAALGESCPALDALVVKGGRLLPHYIVALNGTVFTADPATPLAPGDVLVLLSADAGG
jgi:molybdopterin synthase sulfur carrier subunit